MKIDASVVAQMAQHKLIHEEATRTSATGTTTIDHRGTPSDDHLSRPVQNAAGRPNLSLTPGVEIYPNGALEETNRAYSLEISQSQSASVTISKGESSFSLRTGSSSTLSCNESVTPTYKPLGPIIVSKTKNAEIKLPVDAAGSEQGDLVPDTTPYYDREKHALYLDGLRPTETTSTLTSNRIDKALADSIRGLKLIPEAPRFLPPEVRNAINEANTQTLPDGTKVLPMVMVPMSHVIRQEVSAFGAESSSFHSTGHVTTEDGRDISFDVRVSQSQSFAAHYDQTSFIQSIRLPDFHVQTAPDTLGDQHYILDHDPDKAKGVLSLLSIGGGLLAMDKNGDGKLSSERELFGANSGSALDELAAYDEDGNGWIDENDSVFSSLLIWKDGGDGNAQLVSLLDADVGAIFLDYQKTPYALGNGQQLTGSSIYLKESGTAEVMQQIDFTR